MKKLLPLLLCVMLLTGCGQNNAPSATIAPFASPYEAPVGDWGQEFTRVATLYLPTRDETQLAAVEEEMTFDLRPEEETVLGVLLSHEEGEDFTSLPGMGKVKLMTGDTVTNSCGVVTVNLNAAALALSHDELFTVCQAIGNTLCALDGVVGVNVLASGVSPGLDVAGTLPMGCIKQNLLDDPDMLLTRLLSQRAGGKTGDTPFRVDAALYFPAQAGRGLLCEMRTLFLKNADPGEMTVALLAALSCGADELPNTPLLPDLPELLLEEPVFTQKQGHKMVSLHFSDALNDAMANCGVTRSVMMASIVTTLTTFLPQVSACCVKIGEEQVSALVPAGLYEGAGQVIGFSDGQMRRQDFANFLLTNVPLYFADSEGTLTPSVRALPCAWAHSPRQLYLQLLEAPQYYDTTPALKGVFPSAVSDADLIGTKQEGDTLLLNFSSAFQDACQGMTAREEQNVIYSLVNTMTHGSARRVRIYIMGEQRETLSGAMALTGEFLRSVP